jgi:hypothetical protein
MSQSDKNQHKAQLKNWKAQQRASARAKLPLDKAQMKSMFDMLDEKLSAQGCDHTLKLVHAWLDANKLPIEPVEKWLRESGGYCDCEALANSEDAWEDATHELGDED